MAETCEEYRFRRVSCIIHNYMPYTSILKREAPALAGATPIRSWSPIEDAMPCHVAIFNDICFTNNDVFATNSTILAVLGATIDEIVTANFPPTRLPSIPAEKTATAAAQVPANISPPSQGMSPHIPCISILCARSTSQVITPAHLAAVNYSIRLLQSQGTRLDMAEGSTSGARLRLSGN